MEDYKVTQTGEEIQEILNQSPIDTADIAGLKEADALLDGRLEVVEGKIPAGASAENPLTDKQYVDDSIASASATFRGTYNEVADLGLTTAATHAEIAAALAGTIDVADNNDYCFVQIPTSDATPTEIGSIERYKFVTGTGWEYEYTLNNSGFTADQWAAINSGITSGLVTKLTDLPTNAELNTLLNGKANAAEVYTKSETYNKTELDSMITTPDVQYVSVTATAQTTAVTDVLPATGEADTIYRVGSWDGTQYDANSYSEYAWNGTAYVPLSVKNTGIATGSDFDNPTAAQRALLTTVGAVLDGCDAEPTPGSVKPVQSGGVKTAIDNVTFSTSEKVNEVGIDSEPVAGSSNLVESGGVYAKNQVYDSVIDNVVSPNLFDKTQIIENKYVKYNTGKATSSSGSGYFCTDYIPIDSEGAYAALGVTSGYRGFACYSDKSESAYTHGAVNSNKLAVYQEGDAYVRYTGKLEDVDRFMVVKGTSADYPSAYVPFGNIGELKASTVGNSQIQDGAVEHSKLATESVNEENLSEKYWLAAGISIYGDTVKEVFFLDKAIPDGVSLTFHFYSGRVIFTASLNGNTIWTVDRQFVLNYFYNNVVYPLKCLTSNIETIAAGDVVGYIVFADIDTAKAINDGANRTVNIARVKYLLNNPTIATQTYKIKDSEIVTGMIADGAVSFNKIGFKSVAVISKNFLNEDDPGFKHEQGYYVRWDDGFPGYSSTSTAPNGRTGYIPVSSKGLYFNAYVFGGVYGGAVYDKNKVYRRSTGAHYVYQEGDGYVRWTLAANPISPYTAGQYMVWEGDSSVMPEYDEYAAKDVIDPDVLPPSEAAVQDGSITEAKLSTDVKNSIVGTGVGLCIPDVIPCVVGDTLRIYFRSIVKAPNPYIWDLVAVSTVGKSYPRYYEYKPTAAGNKTVTFYVRNSARSIVAQKAVTIKCITAMSSPASNKNILMVGASMLADGNIAYEINRRLTNVNGDGTPLNPTGLGLSNITFVGRKTGTSYPSIHQEGNSGWSWKDYATIGRYAYRFFVVGQVGIDVRGGSVYSGAGTLKFTVSESDIDIDPTTGTGYFTCTYSGSGTQPASGTLTLFEGEGDATITYDSFSLDSGNPFWNDNTSQLDFITYANSYCNGSIDVLVSITGLNDFTPAGNENGIAARIENYVKPFIRAFHEQFPYSIIALTTQFLGGANGSLGSGYGASGTWNYYNIARMTWKWSELVRELAADDEFSSYVKIIDTNSSLDCENLFSTTPHTVANRSEATEAIQTGGIHTNTAGKKTIADSIYEGLNDIMR